MPNLLAAVAGNLFEIKELAAIKLVDLELPSAFAERYAGPAFGVEGTRRLMGRPDGAMIGTIVKPSIGLSPADLAELVGELAAAGVDFIKDDELQGNGPTAPLAERVRAVMPVLQRHADRTGVMPMYAFNITDDIDRLEANHDLVVDAGGTCVMVCVNLVGLAGLEYIRRRARVPIHGHRTMFGAISRSEQVGFSFRAWQKLARLSGADHLHTNGISNKFYESDAEVLDSIEAVREPLLGLTPTVPVLSSGQWGGLAHATYSAVGTTDLLVLAGGGIHGHPDGSAAGVTSMREAWESAARGESPAEALETSPHCAGRPRRSARCGHDAWISVQLGSRSCRDCEPPSTATTSPGASTRCCSSRAGAGRDACSSACRPRRRSSAPPLRPTSSGSPGSRVRCPPPISRAKYARCSRR